MSTVTGFDAALAAALANGLREALQADDHPRAVSFINRGFAEGSPQLGCDLLCQAIAIVGPGRTWTVQIAPLALVPPRSEPPRSELPRSELPRSEPPRSEPPRSEPRD